MCVLVCVCVCVCVCVYMCAWICISTSNVSERYQNSSSIAQDGWCRHRMKSYMNVNLLVCPKDPMILCVSPGRADVDTLRGAHNFGIYMCPYRSQNNAFFTHKCIDDHTCITFCGVRCSCSALRAEISYRFNTHIWLNILSVRLRIHLVMRSYIFTWIYFGLRQRRDLDTLSARIYRFEWNI